MHKKVRYDFAFAKVSKTFVSAHDVLFYFL